jgi:hypothetical protein
MKLGDFLRALGCDPKVFEGANRAPGKSLVSIW